MWGRSVSEPPQYVAAGSQLHRFGAPRWRSLARLSTFELDNGTRRHEAPSRGDRGSYPIQLTQKVTGTREARKAPSTRARRSSEGSYSQGRHHHYSVETIVLRLRSTSARAPERPRQLILSVDCLHRPLAVGSHQTDLFTALSSVLCVEKSAGAEGSTMEDIALLRGVGD